MDEVTTPPASPELTPGERESADDAQEHEGRLHFALRGIWPRFSASSIRRGDGCSVFSPSARS